jgi:hypothetical protein
VIRANLHLIETIVADGTARGADARAERCIGDDAALPYGIYEFVFAYNSIAILNEINEQIENLRLDRDEFARPSQLVAHGIDHIIREVEIQGSAHLGKE